MWEKISEDSTRGGGRVSVPTLLQLNTIILGLFVSDYGTVFFFVLKELAALERIRFRIKPSRLFIPMTDDDLTKPP